MITEGSIIRLEEKEKLTEAQQDTLKERQRDLMKHPYTCHRCASILSVKEDGFICSNPFCKNKEYQRWFHKVDIK